MTAVLTDSPFKGVNRVVWASLAKGATSDPAAIVGSSDMTIAVSGTFDTATATLQGSNDGTNWFTLSDPLGNALTFTAADMAVIFENPLYLRVTVNSAGAGTTDLKVVIVGGN